MNIRNIEDFFIKESKDIYYFRSPLNITVQLSIELFNTCNYNCSYCFQKTDKLDKAEIDYKKLFFFLEKKFIPEFLKIKKNQDYFLKLNILGGEPSLKSIKFYEEFFKKISKILKNHFKKIKIIFLTNFSKPNSYYKDIYTLCKKNNLDLLIVATIHEEFMTLQKGFKKAKELLKLIPKKYFDIQVFKSEKEIKELLKELNLLELFDIISLNSIDNLEYVNAFKNLKSFLRPVKCYAYNYKIDKNLNIYQKCFKEKYNIINFKFKPFYICDNVCNCASDEYILKKELKNG